jgi:hypothetical protein
MAKAKKQEVATIESLRAKMMDIAKGEVDRVGKGTSKLFMKTSKGEFTYDGAGLGDEFEAVIINFSNTNQLWPFKYDRDDDQSPACAAIGMEENDFLIPDKDSPTLISDSCEDCEYNEWGSADTGNGKKCSNGRILAMLAADSLLDDEVEVALMRLSATSLGKHNAFVRMVERKLKMPVLGIKTLLKVKHDEKGDFSYVDFEAIEAIEDPNELKVVLEQHELCKEDLLPTYDFSNYHEPAKKSKPKAKSGIGKKRSKLS